MSDSMDRSGVSSVRSWAAGCGIACLLLAGLASRAWAEVGEAGGRSASTFFFAEASVLYAPGVGLAVLTVQREVEGEDGPASVNYATADGTLLAGYDYGAVAGTLEFAPGDQEKEVLIPIVSTSQVGEFTVTLSTPSDGSSVGDPASATVSLLKGIRHGVAGTLEDHMIASVHVADMDGDGDLDILASVWEPSQVLGDLAWWENRGGQGESWSKHVVTAQCRGVAQPADVDGDGDMDVVNTHQEYWVHHGRDGRPAAPPTHYPGQTRWFENVSGDGATWQKHTIDGDYGGALFVADADLDGDMDLLVGDSSYTPVINVSSGSVSLFSNSGSGEEWSRSSVESDCRADDPELVDMDGDGDLDILSGRFDLTGSGYNTYLQWTGMGWWQNPATERDAWTWHLIDEDDGRVEVADLDGDGSQDLLVRSQEGERYDLLWWKSSSGDGTDMTLHPLLADVGPVGELHAVDMDGDGDLDLAGSVHSNESFVDDIVWWENAVGDASLWFRHAVEAGFPLAEEPAIGDIDGDGAVDIVAASEYTPEGIAWWTVPALPANPYLAAELTEGESTTVWVALPAPAAQTTAVALTTSHPDRLDMPASVPVDAGEQLVSFAVTAVNDSTANGNADVLLQASMDDFLAATVVTVRDNETLGLEVELPETVTEGQGRLSDGGAVRLDSAVAVPVTVGLTSSMPTEARVPLSVTIPAGEDSVAFDLVMPDDDESDGTQVVSITAAVEGWPPASNTVKVLDDDAVLTLVLPDSVVEGTTAPQVSGSVSTPFVVESDVILNLSATPDSQLDLPPQVVLAAGTNSVSFPVAAVDDEEREGKTAATVTVEAEGWTGDSEPIDIRDNEDGVFGFAAPSVSYAGGQGFAVVTVRRDKAGAAASVDYATDDGTFYSSGYQSQEGTIGFTTGELEKRIVIPILRSYSGTIHIDLSDPSPYAAVGQQRCTVTLENGRIRHSLVVDLDHLQDAKCADIDGDGDQDVVVTTLDYYASPLTGDLAWWENTGGDGVNWRKHTIHWTGGSYRIQCADLDQDGDMDVVAAGQYVTWWENVDGVGMEWLPRVVAHGTYDPRHAVVDLDADGDLDMAGSYGGYVWWGERTGDGYLDWLWHLVVDNDDGTATVDPADVDGDGDLDLLGAFDYDARHIAWWENTHGDAQTWARHTIDLDDRPGGSTYVGDLDGDGDPDLLGAVANWDGLTWWENRVNEARGWTKHRPENYNPGAVFRIYDAQTLDFDGDGDTDVLSTNGEIVVWRNTAGDASEWNSLHVDADFPKVTSIDAGDINGDGTLDVLGVSSKEWNAHYDPPGLGEVAWWTEGSSLPNPYVAEPVIEGESTTVWFLLPTPAGGAGNLTVTSSHPEMVSVPPRIPVEKYQQVVTFEVTAVGDVAAAEQVLVALSIVADNTTYEATLRVRDSAMALTYRAGMHGSLQGETSQTGTFGEDGSAVAAVPNDGYRFVRWSDGVTDNPRTELRVSRDVDVTAVFDPIAFHVTYHPGEYGGFAGGATTVIRELTTGRAPVVPEVVPQEGWMAAGWYPPLPESVTADFATTAQYAPEMDWACRFTVPGSEPQAFTLGMRADATSAMDPELDVETSPPGTGETGAYLYRTEPESLVLSTDAIGTADAGEWYFAVHVGPDAPATVGWEAVGIPDGRYLTLTRVDEDGVPVGTSFRNLERVGELSVDAGDTAFFMIRYGDALVADIALYGDAWNLVSLPVEPLNPAVEAVFDDANEAARRGGPIRGEPLYTGHVWGWQGNAHIPLSELHAETACWVFAKRDAVMLVQGTPSLAGGVDIPAAWSLLGVDAPRSIADSANLDGQGWYWDARAGGHAAEEVLYPCRGYWLKAAQETTLSEGDEYLVIDLSEGPEAASYPVSYRGELPNPIPDSYRTTKLVLRRVPAGTFTMGSSPDEVGHVENREQQHEVTLTQDFYIGVFEVTQKQWERVMGTWPSAFRTAGERDTRPVEQVSYDDIRGAYVGSGWPGDSDVAGHSFLGILHARTGLPGLDLPTEAQWEYACRAGTTTALSNGTDLQGTGHDPNLDLLGRYGHNGGAYGAAPVGSYQPNAWGLYDMHGNIWEWCLDPILLT